LKLSTPMRVKVGVIAGAIGLAARVTIRQFKFTRG
jgi:hypothetical protein